MEFTITITPELLATIKAIIGAFLMLGCFYFYILEDEKEMRQKIEEHYEKWENEIYDCESKRTGETAVSGRHSTESMEICNRTVLRSERGSSNGTGNRAA